MGWTGTYVPRGTAGAYFKDLFTSENDKMKMEVVRAAFHGMFEHYAAVRITTKENGNSYVFGVATKIQWGKGHYNCHYKDMDESMGPYLYNCPESILKELTPTEDVDRLSGGTHKFSKGWRVACWENILAKKAKNSIKNGDIIEFDRDLHFRDHYKGNTFVAKKVGRIIKLFAFDKLNKAWNPYHYYRVLSRDWTHIRVIGKVELNTLRAFEA